MVLLYAFFSWYFHNGGWKEKQELMAAIRNPHQLSVLLPSPGPGIGDTRTFCENDEQCSLLF